MRDQQDMQDKQKSAYSDDQQQHSDQTGAHASQTLGVANGQVSESDEDVEFERLQDSTSPLHSGPHEGPKEDCGGKC